MVNKTEPSPPSQQTQGINPLLQELLEKYPMQVFAALSQIGEGDPTLPSKIATELLSKNNFIDTPKLDRIITLLPALKDLSPEAIKKLKMGENAEFSQNPKNFSKEENSLKTKEGVGGAKGFAREAVTKEGIPSQREGRTIEAKETAPQKIFAPAAANRPIGFALPTLANTIKEVLALLSYFANHRDPVKSEPFDVFQKIMKPVLAQLIRPVQKPMEGERGAKQPEIVGRGERPLQQKESHLPLPREAQRAGDKSLSSHKVDWAPKSKESAERSDRSPVEKNARAQESSALKRNPNGALAEAKPTSTPTTSERTALAAAPFSYQHSISTSPRKAKKNPKDPWEEKKERLEDEEDPFSS